MNKQQILTEENYESIHRMLESSWDRKESLILLTISIARRVENAKKLANEKKLPFDFASTASTIISLYLQGSIS